jgi:nitroimidazol reductase NimA-like FMN-containing flavoprotein (pyridoxamine 5'-phosphate oxidase superfamily)
MSADDAAVTVLGEDECWSLLSSLSLGRLVTILGGKPEIFPVNFATRRRTVLFRTAQGTKLYSAVMGDWVAFEADYHDPALTYGWSVIIKGRAHLLSANADILDAEEAPLRPWTATPKPIYVRVVAMEITGRRFKFGPEPDHGVING